MGVFPDVEATIFRVTDLRHIQKFPAGDIHEVKPTTHDMAKLPSLPRVFRIGREVFHDGAIVIAGSGECLETVENMVGAIIKFPERPSLVAVAVLMVLACLISSCGEKLARVFRT